MKKDKIINGFCYLDGDDMIFVSLFNERKYDYPASLFKATIKEDKITEYHIILVNEDNKVISPLFKNHYKSLKPIKNMDFEILIKEVYKLCIEITKDFRNDQV